MERSPLLDMLFGYMPTQMLYTAAELGIADALADGPRTYTELAEAAGASPPAMRRLLRALAGIGVVTQLDAERFELTELGDPLRSDAPGSIRGLVGLFAGPEVWAAWGALPHAVRTGEPTWQKVTATTPFEFFEQNPALGDTFNRAMAEHTRQVAPGILAGYDFTRFATIADLGGGDGTLLAAILAAVPGPRGLLFDLRQALRTAAGVLAAGGVADRCEVVAGDFFEEVPAGADAYLLKSVIHDWDDEQAVAILCNVRAAMGADARLLLVEFVLPEVVTPDDPGNTGSDLNMLVNTGGRERTEREFRELLDAAGLTVTTITDALPPAGYRVIEAVSGGSSPAG
jgi:O-methyltransferase/methyltransferase family protein